MFSPLLFTTLLLLSSSLCPSSASTVLLDREKAEVSPKDRPKQGFIGFYSKFKYARYYHDAHALRQVRKQLPYMLMMDPIGPDHSELNRKYDLYCVLNKPVCTDFVSGFSSFCQKAPDICDPLHERFHFNATGDWHLAKTTYWSNFRRCPFCQAQYFQFDVFTT